MDIKYDVDWDIAKIENSHFGKNRDSRMVESDIYDFLKNAAAEYHVKGLQQEEFHTLERISEEYFKSKEVKDNFDDSLEHHVSDKNIFYAKLTALASRLGEKEKAEQYFEMITAPLDIIRHGFVENTDLINVNQSGKQERIHRYNVLKEYGIDSRHNINRIFTIGDSYLDLARTQDLSEEYKDRLAKYGQSMLHIGMKNTAKLMQSNPYQAKELLQRAIKLSNYMQDNSWKEYFAKNPGTINAHTIYAPKSSKLNKPWLSDMLSDVTEFTYLAADFKEPMDPYKHFLVSDSILRPKSFFERKIVSNTHKDGIDNIAAMFEIGKHYIDSSKVQGLSTYRKEKLNQYGLTMLEIALKNSAKALADSTFENRPQLLALAKQYSRLTGNDMWQKLFTQIATQEKDSIASAERAARKHMTDMIKLGNGDDEPYITYSQILGRNLSNSRKNIVDLETIASDKSRTVQARTRAYLNAMAYTFDAAKDIETFKSMENYLRFKHDARENITNYPKADSLYQHAYDKGMNLIKSRLPIMARLESMQIILSHLGNDPELKKVMSRYLVSAIEESRISKNVKAIDYARQIKSTHMDAREFRYRNRSITQALDEAITAVEKVERKIKHPGVVKRFLRKLQS